MRFNGRERWKICMEYELPPPFNQYDRVGWPVKEAMRGSTAGIDDGLQAVSSKHYHILTLLDKFISTMVITPLVVAYWRGTWGCTDIFVFRNEPDKSALFSVIVGAVGSLLFTLAQNQFLNKIHSNINRIKYYLITRLYTACFGIFCVNHFRGAWQCLDLYTSYDTVTVAIITVSSIIILFFTKTLRNLSAPPFAITIDRYEDYFTVPTFFRYSSDKTWLYLLDCIFSVCVIGTLVIFVWRGTWVLCDLLLLPDSAVMSACASAVIGYSLVMLTFCMQPLMKYLAKTLSGIVRLIIVDVYLLFSFCGTVNVWRGIWNLLNFYFLPGMVNTSFILTHVISFLILMLINSSNSILVRGVYLDCEEQGEQCVDFPCYYIRLFFQTRRQRKLLRHCEKNSGGIKRKGDFESVAILPQDGKKPIIIVPVSRNNNEVTQPML